MQRDPFPVLLNSNGDTTSKAEYVSLMYGLAGISAGACLSPVADVKHKLLLALDPLVGDAVAIPGLPAREAPQLRLLLDASLSALPDLGEFLERFVGLVAHARLALFGGVVNVLIDNRHEDSEILKLPDPFPEHTVLSADGSGLVDADQIEGARFLYREFHNLGCALALLPRKGAGLALILEGADVIPLLTSDVGSSSLARVGDAVTLCLVFGGYAQIIDRAETLAGDGPSCNVDCRHDRLTHVSPPVTGKDPPGLVTRPSGGVHSCGSPDHTSTPQPWREQEFEHAAMGLQGAHTFGGNPCHGAAF